MNTPTQADTEEFRDDIRRIIENYPSLTIIQVVGTLDMMKQEMWDRLRMCDHPSSNK